MTEQHFWDLIDTNKSKLCFFIGTWHPASGVVFNRGLKITAPNVEKISESIRNQIREENLFEQPPLTQFEEAINKRNYDKVTNLLQSAWFGVPESTDCWRITGFAEAVEILEDPIE